ncbi:unnamed protein product [Linum trigynum]|uniref:Reverse transcriptase zinc-binding domain-containing protein n=1 Tax=Linum trigynum TaxID=586398 RepID=A0AAV2FM21_9ROSI
MEEEEYEFLRELWRWKGPSRVKHFLWLVLHHRLMTNKERVEHKLTMNCNFKRGNGSKKTVEHISRDCRRTKGV